MNFSHTQRDHPAKDVEDFIPHRRTGGRSRNLQIQWLRGLAALLVVICHASPSILGITSYHGILNSIDYVFGFFPVALFFAISGYLMSIAIQIQSPILFLSHRLVRIYPLYFLVVGTVWLAHFATGAPIKIDLITIILAPTNSFIYPLNGVEWTLIIEISFYIALFFVILSRGSKHVYWLAGIWLIWLLITSWMQPGNPTDLSNVYLVAANGAMAGGLLVPLILKLNPHPVIPFLAVAFCLICMSGILPVTVTQDRWLANGAGVLMVLGMVALSQRNPSSSDNRIGRLMSRFGDYSYALYLCHFPIIGLVYSLLKPSSYVIIFSICVVLSVLASIVVGTLDVWLYGHLKRAVNNTNPYLRAIIVFLFLGVFLGVSLSILYQRSIGTIRMEQFAYKTAPLIAAKGKIEISTDAEEVMRAAGFTKSNELLGVVDYLHWNARKLKVKGWAIDISHIEDQEKYGKPVSVAFFQDGELLAITVTAKDRPDIENHFHTNGNEEYELSVSVPCRSDHELIGVIFNMEKLFAVMPPAIISCQKP